MQSSSRTQTTLTLTSTSHSWVTLFQQCLRFGIVGILNVGIDLLAFNILIWLFPTQNSNILFWFNALAYSLGAVNSFILNKCWTFCQKQQINAQQIMRFVIVNLMGICCNSAIVWILVQMLHPFATNTFLLANTAKMLAIVATALISFLGMHLWVFATSAHNEKETPSSVIHALETYESSMPTHRQTVLDKDIQQQGQQPKTATSQESETFPCSNIFENGGSFF